MISTSCQYLGLNECVEENQTKEFCTKILRHWSSITQSNSQSNFEISLPIHYSSALFGTGPVLILIPISFQINALALCVCVLNHRHWGEIVSELHTYYNRADFMCINNKHIENFHIMIYLILCKISGVFEIENYEFYHNLIKVKFGFSEKATKFEKIFVVLLTRVS